MKSQIYADNAATTPLDKVAFDALIPWLSENYGNASQPYAFSREPKKALAEARETIAACIHALPEEIYFTSGGTEGDNWAIKGSAFADVLKKTTITTTFEHHAVLHSCKAIEHLGYPVVYLRPNSDGIIVPDSLRKALDDQPRFVSVMYANNEIGTIQPIKALCSLAHECRALFHTDAVQALGHTKIDVHDLGVDMLSASAHKFNGPKGIGFLYLRKGTKILSYADGGAQEHGMRAGTENVASIIGMAVALKHNCDSLSDNEAHVTGLEQMLLEGLRAVGISFVRNGGGYKLPGLISLSFDGADGEALLHRLDLMGISVSTGSACNSANTEISHVLKAIGLRESLAKGTIRISLGKYNTDDDVDFIVVALKKILGSYAK